MRARKIAGLSVIVGVFGLTLVMVSLNMLNLSELYTIVVAELLVALPVVLAWMFKPEFDKYFERRKVTEQALTTDERAFPEIMDALQQKAELDAVDKLNKTIIFMPSFGLSPYSHLTLHFSRKKDTPQKPHRPYYIINHSENNAFWAPEFILKLAIGNWIQWITHDGEQALQEYLDKNGIKLNEWYPTSYKNDLGISLADLSKKLIPDSGIGQNATTPSLKGAESVERLYGTARLIFKIRSTSDWFAVGLVDSKHVKITDWKSNTTITPPRPTDDPNLSHIEVHHRFVPELELSVTALFDVYQGDNITVFLRKGNLGNLKVEVFDKNGNYLDGCDYTHGDGEGNYKEFGFEFTVDAQW